MAINLTKGQNVKLNKESNKIKIGLSWDVKDSGNPFDLDVAAIGLTDKNGNAVSDKYFVYYGNLKSPDNAIIHSGDNLTGEGDGDDEVISFDFSKLDDRVNAIIIVINIYQAKLRKQNFGQVKNPKARLYYSDSNVPDLIYELDEDFSNSTTVEFVMLYKNNGEWKFKAIGEGNENDMKKEIEKFGL